MKTLTELQSNILEWAEQRNLLYEENAINQRLKLIEECGELAKAILENNINKQKDGIGDVFVVLMILAAQLNIDLDLILERKSKPKPDVFKPIYMIIGNCSDLNSDIQFNTYWLKDLCLTLNLDLTECVNMAWNEIKDRTGKTVNGTFIKD